MNENPILAMDCPRKRSRGRQYWRRNDFCKSRELTPTQPLDLKNFDLHARFILLSAANFAIDQEQLGWVYPNARTQVNLLIAETAPEPVAF